MLCHYHDKSCDYCDCIVMVEITVSHHLDMFCGHWSIESGDIKYLICYVTSQNRMIEKSKSFVSRTSSEYVSRLPSFMAMVIAVVETCFWFVT